MDEKRGTVTRMRRSRIDAGGWWQVLGVAVGAALFALSVLLLELPRGAVPPWLVAAITTAFALAAAGGLLFLWRGGRRAQEVEMRWWIRNGALPPDLPLVERLQRIRRADDAISRGWGYIVLGGFWALFAIWSGPGRLIPAGVWFAGGAYWLAQSLPHRRTIKRLLAETEAEAAAAGIRPREI